MLTTNYASRRRVIPILTPLADAFKRFIRPSEIVTSFAPMWQTYQPTYTAWKYDRVVEEAYLKNELIFACVNARTDAITTISMKVYQKSTNEHLKDHPLQKLLERPNPFMTENDFWMQTIQNLDLAGLAPFQKLINSSGQVIQLWPLRPDKLGFKRSGAMFVSGYAYRADDGYEYDLKPEQVFYFINRDPRDMLKPVAPALVAGRQIDVDNAETDHMRLHWEKGGVPPVVLTSKNKLDKEQRAAARVNWTERYGGYQNWQTPVILDGETTVQMLGFSFKDMGIEIIDGRTETRTCMVMRVPPIVIATMFGLSRSTFSNAETIIRGWWENVNQPQFNKLADQVNLDVTPLFGEDIEARWDYANVPALQTDRNDKVTRGAVLYTKGLATKNEARVEAGMEKTDDPSGEEFIKQPDTSGGVAFGFAPRGTPQNGGNSGADKQALFDEAARVEARERVRKALEQVQPRGMPLPSEMATDVDEFTPEEIAAGEDRFRHLRHALRSNTDA